MDAKQKILIDVVMLGIGVLVVLWLYKYMSKNAADDFWKNEEIANAKRLFGDGCKDSINLG